MTMTTPKSKPVLWIALAIALFVSLISGGAASAKSDSHKAKPHPNSIKVSEAVTQIVQGLKLNIDNIRFIKEPKASDYYSKVKDNAPYAHDFIVAQFTGLDLPKNIDPNAYVTREQFAKWLYGGLSSTGEYMWVELFIEVKDANKVSKGYMESIQKLLIAGIATLDGNNRFWPQLEITKAQADRMVKRAQAFVEKNNTPVNPEIGILSDVKLSTEDWGNDVVRVTVSALAPHRGYGIDIAGVQFVKGKAIVSYRVVQPDPAAFYAQVVTEVKAYAYIPKGYQAVLGEQAPSEPRTNA